LTLYKEMIIDLHSQLRISFANLELPEELSVTMADAADAAPEPEPESADAADAASSGEGATESILDYVIGEETLGCVSEGPLTFAPEPPAAATNERPPAGPQLSAIAKRLQERVLGEDALPINVRKTVADSIGLGDSLGGGAAAGGLPPARPAVSVYLCTSCLWRHEQLKIALVPNIAMISEHTAAYGTEVHWVIITAPGTGEEVTLQALQELKDWPRLQQVRLTLGFVDTRATGGAFHMSFAKNASHMLARKEAVSRAVNDCDASSVILVNLDCDNIIGPKFLPALLETFANPRLQILQARGWESATTGRIAVRLSAFEAVNGYDEEPGVLGSGYQAGGERPEPVAENIAGPQDIDFLKRVGAWASASATRKGGGGYRASLQCGKGAAAAHDAVGFAIDNDLHNKARERGDAKLDHVSNEAKYKWGAMNARNMQTMCAKEGYFRNAYKTTRGDPPVGWPVQAMVHGSRAGDLLGKDLAAFFAVVQAKSGPKADALGGLPRAPPPPLASGLAHLNKPIYVFSYGQAVVDR
ncbi:unnamed protein product, partial [Effrenium voratum]